MSNATDMLDLYIKAEKAVLSNQSYTVDGQSVTKANLTEIRKGKNQWQRVVNSEMAASQGGSSMSSVADFTE